MPCKSRYRGPLDNSTTSVTTVAVAVKCENEFCGIIFRYEHIAIKDLSIITNLTHFCWAYECSGQFRLVTGDKEILWKHRLFSVHTLSDWIVHSLILFFSFFFSFFNQQLFFFFFHTQHNIQNKTKQNNRHILNISRSNQKGGGEGRTTITQKSLLYTITYVQKTLTFTWHYLQEATDPICFSTHVWCKPVLDYCLLRSCKTSKQHSLLHWTNTETWIIIKETQTWVNRPITSQ